MTKSVGGEWALVNPSVMASETGSTPTVSAPVNNINNVTTVSVGSESRLIFGFWTNQATLSIILVLGNILLIVNLILFVTIYRRARCGQCKRGGGDDNSDEVNSIQVSFDFKRFLLHPTQCPVNDNALINRMSRGRT